MRSSIFILPCLTTVSTALFARREVAAPAPTAAKYYDSVTGFNFTQYTTPQGVNYRIAISSNATKSAPFGAVLQVVAPLSVIGWTGFAWGGHMQNDPLTVAWASGKTPIVSSRRATQYSQPQPYSGAAYTILPTSSVNSTHLRADLLCVGCSQWNDQNNKPVALDPSSTNTTFAYATCSTAATNPSSNTTGFSKHNEEASFTLNLASAKNDNFDALVAKARNGTATIS